MSQQRRPQQQNRRQRLVASAGERAEAQPQPQAEQPQTQPSQPSQPQRLQPQQARPKRPLYQRPPPQQPQAQEATAETSQDEGDANSSDAEESIFLAEIQEAQPAHEPEERYGEIYATYGEPRAYGKHSRDPNSVLIVKTGHLKGRPDRGTYAWVRRRDKSNAANLIRAERHKPRPLSFSGIPPYPPFMGGGGGGGGGSRAPPPVNQDEINRLVQEQVRLQLAAMQAGGMGPQAGGAGAGAGSGGDNLLLTMDLRLNGVRPPLDPRNLTASWRMPAA